ncbi:hypothetical protein P7C70_g398, partial [Phenoliferia sp. Uapishka_3]
MDRTPASVLLRPSRPTTAATSSDEPQSSSFRFLQPVATTTTNSPSYSPPLSPPQLQGPIPNLLPIFAKYPTKRKNRGQIRIRVDNTAFYCHKDVLVLASPFFESCITGGWKETEPRANKLGTAGAPTLAGQREGRQGQEVNSVEPAAESERELDSPVSSKRQSFQTSKTTASSSTETSVDIDPPDPESTPPSANSAPPHTTAFTTTQMDPSSPPGSDLGEVAPSITVSYISSIFEDDEIDSDDDEEGDEQVICRLRLVEENASSFQDLLCHLYPRLECLISWNNAGDLCRMASKFDIPSLRNACIAFLLPSAAGKPIAGMRIAEEMNIPELYKEASRYTLDNYQNWPQEELALLSQPTLLKLERRRSWFLERLLKLGLVQTSKDYVCQPTCPDTARCAALVDEKWKSAVSSNLCCLCDKIALLMAVVRAVELSFQIWDPTAASFFILMAKNWN